VGGITGNIGKYRQIGEKDWRGADKLTGKSLMIKNFNRI
jgi:hypothetical protein